MNQHAIDPIHERYSRSSGITGEALGQSEVFLEFQAQLSLVAPVNRPVLLVGERGTGKELAATRLHFLSKRWQGPLITLNCATLSPSLMETELFGHERGAFTGAQQRRPGRFELAHNGSLFLDEIGSIPMEVQEKILRVVEYARFERVGGVTPVEVDVRIIGATNADLPQLAAQGLFKRDLLDRLAFEVLNLPPLRERMGDVGLLATHFATRMAYELGWDETPSFAPAALAELERHPWPGNVRELKNAVERAVYRSNTSIIETIVFDPFVSIYTHLSSAEELQPVQKETETSSPLMEKTGGEETVWTQLPFKEAIRRLEMLMLRHAMQKSRHNQKKAATLLGLTYDQFRGLWRKYNGLL